VLDGLVMSALPPLDRADTTFKTWIHESLHARQFGPAPPTTARDHPGYEEGMVEGLARLVTRDLAGMQPLATAYTYYVEAYRSLSQVTGISVERLWRALWQYPRGHVRDAFVDTVDEIIVHAGGPALTGAQHSDLRGWADRFFSRSRFNDVTDPSGMISRWQSVFQ
jgi:hypothetical protein